MSKKTTKGVKSSVKFLLPAALKNKAIGGEIKLTCGSSFNCTTSLDEFLVAVYAATRHSPVVFNDRHTGLDEAWLPVEVVEKTMVGRKYLLKKLEWLAS